MLPAVRRAATDVSITLAGPRDIERALDVERRAFGHPEEAELVRALLDDPTATPRLSLLARDGDAVVGHALFTAVRVEGSDARGSILCPLAVVPEAQGRGVGAALTEAGLARLADVGVELVFVLGDPSYYSRFGFVPAGARGFDAPYPIEPRNAGAWRVHALREGALGSPGRVRCADALMRPELWRE